MDLSCQNGIRRFFSHYQCDRTSILVAVSGGCDSMALVHVLLEMQHELGIGLVSVAHVNHGLRAQNSDADMEFVQKASQDLRLKCFTTILVPPADRAHGIEEWARKERYTFLMKCKKEYGFSAIATAHSENDMAETVLMRILRGSSIVGASGIVPVREDGVIRPLIYVSRSVIQSYVSAKNLPFCTDASNTDLAYNRNWLRHEVFPLLNTRYSSALKQCAQFGHCCADATQIIDISLDTWEKEFLKEVSLQEFSIDQAGLLNGALARYAVSRIFRLKETPLDYAHVELILASRLKFGKTFLLPGWWRLYPTRLGLRFVLEVP